MHYKKFKPKHDFIVPEVVPNTVNVEVQNLDLLWFELFLTKITPIHPFNHDLLRLVVGPTLFVPTKWFKGSRSFIIKSWSG